MSSVFEPNNQSISANAIMIVTAMAMSSKFVSWDLCLSDNYCRVIISKSTFGAHAKNDARNRLVFTDPI